MNCSLPSPLRRLPLTFLLTTGLVLCQPGIGPGTASAQAVAQTRAPETTHELLPFVPSPHTPTYGSQQEFYGPYSGTFLRGGRGLSKPLPEKDPILTPEVSWTLSVWVEIQPGEPSNVTLAGVGMAADSDSRLFVLENGIAALRLSPTETLRANGSLTTGWHLLTATFQASTVRFLVDGLDVASGSLHAGPVSASFELAPVLYGCGRLVCPHFGGRLAELTLRRTALSDTEVAAAYRERPDFDLIAFEDGSKPWPVQTVQYVGNPFPQEPATLPVRKAPFSQPVVNLPADRQTHLVASDADPAGDWTIDGGWLLAAAPDVTAAPEQIASPSFDARGWMPAVVPGTVLTTMIANGRYPDPDFGLDNLSIPEKLNKQDYWYRVVFRVPPAAGHEPHLRLDGINYRAEVWLNGARLGETTGAFLRGVFDVGPALHRDADNVLAIRLSPPPHPGIPNVQSIALGSGLNGGAMALDGPTFMATEGWDWFPPMHDRDTGLWQTVHLVTSGEVSLGDPQVITHLPLPDISQADVTIVLPLLNTASRPVEATVNVAFEGVELHRDITVAPGESSVQFTPDTVPALHLAHPRLWWPNGYGKPELYHLDARVTVAGQLASEQKLRFGVREISYELSLLDNHGDLRRLEYTPTLDRNAPHGAVDVTHEGMRQIPGGYAASLTAGADQSPALRPVADARSTPDLILKVNGVRIAVRGGSWGMEDTRKRISREHLEPYFRLDRDANVNIIRNWQGQNTEPLFYDLADEYGLMVWNDFWEVTQDSNAEAGDSALFLKNAADTVRRYRNHASIVVWCGRNEGVPQPAINTGMIDLLHTLDGTRYYFPSSNQINLEPSGPYSWEDPARYYTTLDRGFAVEVGTPSLPTLEWFHRWLPKEDQWPIDDAWGYHNWHPHDAFSAAMQRQFGAAASLEQYVRQAQMMNYVDYRAIFEGFNQHLWAPNGGRLLWMTQPAWPSMLWGILSSDYDTQASFFGTMKGCEPLHVQLDYSDGDVAVINTTRNPMPRAMVTADILSLSGKPLFHTQATMDAASDTVTGALHLALDSFEGNTTILVHLELKDAQGKLVSHNLYWLAATDAGYRALNAMTPATVTTTAHLLPGKAAGSGDRTLEVMLHNSGSVPSLQTKLTLEDEQGQQILPAYYTDNYVSLLPGETQTILVQIPDAAASRSLHFNVAGWNQPAEKVALLSAGK